MFTVLTYISLTSAHTWSRVERGEIATGESIATAHETCDEHRRGNNYRRADDYRKRQGTKCSDNA